MFENRPEKSQRPFAWAKNQPPGICEHPAKVPFVEPPGFVGVNTINQVNDTNDPPGVHLPRNINGIFLVEPLNIFLGVAVKAQTGVDQQ